MFRIQTAQNKPHPAIRPTEADWGDYRYNKLEDIARMQKVGVKNLPSIYINGRLVYDSIIPSVDELVKRIRGV